jgi:hypothetical protein
MIYLLFIVSSICCRGYVGREDGNCVICAVFCVTQVRWQRIRVFDGCFSVASVFCFYLYASCLVMSVSFLLDKRCILCSALCSLVYLTRTEKLARWLDRNDSCLHRLLVFGELRFYLAAE